MPDPLPVIDPRPLRELLEMGVDRGIVGELLAILKDHAPACLAALGQAVAAGDADAALAEAHRLKGSVGNMGLMRLADLTARVEACLQAGDWEAARRLMESLPPAYEEALAAFQAVFPEA